MLIGLVLTAANLFRFLFENLYPKEKLIVQKCYGKRQALQLGLLSVLELGQSVKIKVHYHLGLMGGTLPLIFPAFKVLLFA